MIKSSNRISSYDDFYTIAAYVSFLMYTIARFIRPIFALSVSAVSMICPIIIS